MAQHHTVKKINPYFSDMWQGSMRFDVRWNDQNFQVGDIVTLQEFDPSGEQCDRSMVAEITYVLTSEDFPHAIIAGCAVLSLKILQWCKTHDGVTEEKPMQF